MKNISLLILSLAALTVSHATPMQMSAVFNGRPADLNGSSLSLPFGGAFTYLYDSALIPTTGAYEITNVAPTTLLLDNPTVGTTFFNALNTYVQLDFNDGLLVGVLLGDRGDVGGVGTGRDDFSVIMFDESVSSFRGIFYTFASDTNFFGMDLAFPGSFSTAAVPETASTVGLFALGLVGLALVRARRHQQFA